MCEYNIAKDRACVFLRSYRNTAITTIPSPKWYKEEEENDIEDDNAEKEKEDDGNDDGDGNGYDQIFKK